MWSHVGLRHNQFFQDSMSRMLSWLLTVAAIGATQAVCAERNLSDFLVGINCHEYHPENLPLLSDLGLTSGRVDVTWHDVTSDSMDVDPDRPRLRSVTAAPLHLDQTLPIFCYGHPSYQNMGRPTEPEAVAAFASFCRDAAEVLQSRTHMVEIWNEWNVIGMGNTPRSEGRGKPEDYVRLLQRSFEAIKQAVPDSVVLGGAMGGIGEQEDYLPRALKAGLLDFCDGLSVHPYFFGAETLEERIPENAIPAKMRKLEQWLSAYPGGNEKPLYVTELGWPTYHHDEGVTQEEQARHMVRSILLFALEPRVSGVWIYELRDSGTDPSNREHNYGVVTRDGKPKASYYALKDLVSLMSEAKRIKRLPSCEDCFAVVLEKKQGGQSCLAWSLDEEKGCFIEIKGESSPRSPKMRALGRFEFDQGEELLPRERKALAAMPLVITDLSASQTLKISAEDR
jgi:hypothetical protein